jgi:phage shock protein PspC (stress-responsive transcriptional regulator)
MDGVPLIKVDCSLQGHTLVLIYGELFIMLNRRVCMTKKLYRSRTDRKLWGVCGGLAKYFDLDPTIIRIIALASLFVGSLGFWTYIIMALVVPVES